VADTPEIQELITPDYYSMHALRLGHGHEELLGRELVAANIRSLAARYADVAEALERDGFTGTGNPMVSYWPNDYKYRPVMRQRFSDYPEAITALNCYEYQTCERTDGRNYVWEQVVTRTRRNVATRWAEEAGAKWEWSREEAAEQMAALRIELHEQYLAAK
jgi:arylsulfatase A-like enzyme